MTEKLKEIHKQSIGYITAAFGLVVGLAWNDAIKSGIEFFFPLDQNGLIIKFVYAVALTIVVIVVSGYLLKAEEK